MEDARFECRRLQNKENILRYALGRRAHVVAVEEELTWLENWDDIEDRLQTICAAPICIQVFDSIDMQDVINRERGKEIHECHMQNRSAHRSPEISCHY